MYICRCAFNYFYLLSYNNLIDMYGHASIYCPFSKHIYPAVSRSFGVSRFLEMQTPYYGMLVCPDFVTNTKLVSVSSSVRAPTSRKAHFQHILSITMETLGRTCPSLFLTLCTRGHSALLHGPLDESVNQH